MRDRWGLEVPAEQVEEVRALVSRHFTVTDVFYEGGSLTFRVFETEIKERFKSLYRELSKAGYVPVSERDEAGVKVKVYRFQTATWRRSLTPLVLLLVTLVTTFLDGYLRSLGGGDLLRPPYNDPLFSATVYAAAVMAIIGIHELGHKISARIDGIETSLPYFIPGIPGTIPTFGAVIFQRGPIANRDDLFDLGVSGPVAGFAVALVVTYLSYSTATWLPADEVMRLVEEGKVAVLGAPLIFELFDALMGRENLVPIFPPFGFAAWLGMVVTSLNLLPIWQLDGGRIFRSFLSRRAHLIASYVCVGLLALTGYFFFAILLLLMMRIPSDIPVLDNVSPLSRGRKLAVAGVMAMIVVTFVVMSFPLPLRR
jgi:Zn-dependent protease